MKRESDRPVARKLVLLFVLAALSAVLLGAAGGAGAGAPIVAIVMTSSPSAVTAPTANGVTYIGYPVTVTNNSTSTVTHATLTDPATPDPLTGSPVFTPVAGLVFEASTCAKATTLYNANNVASGVQCDLGNIAAGASVTVTLVYSIHSPIGVGSIVHNQSAVTVNEGPSDNQPGASHTDTFFSTTDGVTPAPATTSVADPASNAISSFTLPKTTTDLTTDPLLSKTNQQSTAIHVPANGAPNGVAVTARETLPTSYAGICPSTVTCFGEVSFITVSPSGKTSPFATSPLSFTISLYKDEVPGGVGPKTLQVFHDGNLVPSCSKDGTSVDPSGDCIVSIFRNSGGTIIYTVQGPSNGSWGHA